MLGFLMVSAAFAEECARIPLDEVTLAMDGAAAMAVRGVTGALQIASGDGDVVRASGSACAAGAEIHLARKAGVIVATVTMPREVDGVELRLVVPRSLPALDVEGQTGPLRIDGVPSRLAVLNSTGPVAVQGSGSLRLANVTGPVEADTIDGDVVVDHMVGPLVARDVDGDVLADGITGQVAVAEVGGDLAVENGIGDVLHSGVHGQVRLR
jgi:hypothetical protein